MQRDFKVTKLYNLNSISVTHGRTQAERLIMSANLMSQQGPILRQTSWSNGARSIISSAYTNTKWPQCGVDRVLTLSILQLEMHGKAQRIACLAP